MDLQRYKLYGSWGLEKGSELFLKQSTDLRVPFLAYLVQAWMRPEVVENEEGKEEGEDVTNAVIS